MKTAIRFFRLAVLFCFFSDPNRARAAITSGSASIAVANSVTIGKSNSTGFNPTQAGQAYSTGVQFTSIGSGAGAFNEVYAVSGTIAANTNTSFALYGSLVDMLGFTINFVRIKGITVELLTDTTASSITFAGGASNPFLGPLGGTTPTETIANGGVWSNARSDATGWPVNSSTALNIKLVNNDVSNVATYRITLIGATS